MSQKIRYNKAILAIEEYTCKWQACQAVIGCYSAFIAHLNKHYKENPGSCLHDRCKGLLPHETIEEHQERRHPVKLPCPVQDCIIYLSPADEETLLTHIKHSHPLKRGAKHTFKPIFLPRAVQSYPIPPPLPGPGTLKLPIYPHKSSLVSVPTFTPSPQKRHRLVRMSVPEESASAPSVSQGKEEEEEGDEDETTGGRQFPRCPGGDLAMVMVVAIRLDKDPNAVLSPAGWAKKGVHSRA